MADWWALTEQEQREDDEAARPKVIDPVDPAKLAGPLVGDLMVYTSPYEAGSTIVRVVERSYVWAPDQNNYDGTFGTRHYDWSVVEFLSTHHQLVVNDTDLSPIR